MGLPALITAMQAVAWIVLRDARAVHAVSEQAGTLRGISLYRTHQAAAGQLVWPHGPMEAIAEITNFAAAGRIKASARYDGGGELLRLPRQEWEGAYLMEMPAAPWDLGLLDAGSMAADEPWPRWTGLMLQSRDILDLWPADFGVQQSREAWAELQCAQHRIRTLQPPPHGHVWAADVVRYLAFGGQSAWGSGGDSQLAAADRFAATAQDVCGALARWPSQIGIAAPGNVRNRLATGENQALLATVFSDPFAVLQPDSWLVSDAPHLGAQDVAGGIPALHIHRAYADVAILSDVVRVALGIEVVDGTLCRRGGGSEVTIAGRAITIPAGVAPEHQAFFVAMCESQIHQTARGRRPYDVRSLGRLVKGKGVGPARWADLLNKWLPDDLKNADRKALPAGRTPEINPTLNPTAHK